MVSLIIIALIFLWLTATLCAGYLLECAANAMKRRHKARSSASASERNIQILPAARRKQYEKMAS